MVLYFAADLLWGSKIKGMADDLAIPCRPARTVEMLAARLADSPVAAMLVDLSVPETAMALIAHARSARGGAIRLAAFGPHVDKSLLQAARDAGCDEVLTRGALEHALPEVLSRLASPPGTRSMGS